MFSSEIYPGIRLIILLKKVQTVVVRDRKN